MHTDALSDSAACSVDLQYMCASCMKGVLPTQGDEMFLGGRLLFPQVDSTWKKHESLDYNKASISFSVQVNKKENGQKWNSWGKLFVSCWFAFLYAVLLWSSDCDPQLTQACTQPCNPTFISTFLTEIHHQLKSSGPSKKVNRVLKSKKECGSG